MQLDHILSEKQKLQSALEQTQEQLIHAEKMASLGQLMAGIAHELNNPIAFINGNATALKMGFDELMPVLTEAQQCLQSRELMSSEVYAALITEMREAIAGLLRGSARVQHIVSSLRTFSHNGEGPFKAENLHDLIDASLTILSPKLHQIELIKRYGQLPLVPCQAARISQVLLNVLDNAIAAMPTGGQLIIHSMQVGNFVALTISDSGAGMDEHTRKKMFDPFFTTKQVGKGTGLGMSISYGIIADHQGSIQTHSRPGVGTEVVIYLPLGSDEPN